MPVMGFTKFERFFRTAGEVRVDRDDVRRYLDFVNDAIYDMLLLAQATAKANVRDVILPWDLPITAGVQERMHRFAKMDEDIELDPILEEVAAAGPGLCRRHGGPASCAVRRDQRGPRRDLQDR